MTRSPDSYPQPTRDPAGTPERLLVNYWYAPPVGHALEGLRYCLGYKVANPALSVSLLLNAATPVELADLCPFIDEVYAVPFTTFMEVPNDPARALAAVPRDWDWVAENHRVRDERHQSFPGFRTFFDAAHEHFAPHHPTSVAGAEPPAYEPHQRLRLEPPEEARDAAARLLPEGSLAISVLLAGSSAERHLYPSATSWELILRALARRNPDAVFCLIGKLDNDARTTSRVARKEVDRLLAAVPAVDCFDRPLLEQLAILDGSELLVSPHTGFSFLASTVGHAVARHFRRQLARILLQRRAVLLTSFPIRSDTHPSRGRASLRSRSKSSAPTRMARGHEHRACLPNGYAKISTNFSTRQSY
jgi:hypothetical protein